MSNKENLRFLDNNKSRFSEKEIVLGAAMYMALVLQKRGHGPLSIDRKIERSQCEFSKRSFLFLCKVIDQNHGNVDATISSLMIMSKGIAARESHAECLSVCKGRLDKLVSCK
jgi:hypothetical protein